MLTSEVVVEPVADASRDVIVSPLVGGGSESAEGNGGHNPIEMGWDAEVMLKLSDGLDHGEELELERQTSLRAQEICKCP